MNAEYVEKVEDNYRLSENGERLVERHKDDFRSNLPYFSTWVVKPAYQKINQDKAEKMKMVYPPLRDKHPKS